MFGELRQRHAVAGRKRVIGRADHHQRLQRRCSHTNLGLILALEDKADMRVVIQYHAHDLSRGSAGDRDVDTGIVMLELVDDLRERATEEAFADSEHHAAGSKFAKFGQSIEECFPIGELGTVIFESQLPRRRQFNRPPPPLNERHTKFLLELRDLPADRRDGDADLVTGKPHRP